jgi:cardiolipin synthase
LSGSPLMFWAIFYLAGSLAIGLLVLMLFLALFEPGVQFRIGSVPSATLDSEDFLRMISALTNATAHPKNRVEVLTNGEAFYEAELDGIRSARRSINIEAYIFHKSRIANRVVDALIERAQAGVRVNLVVDGIGSFAAARGFLEGLRKAGARVAIYHPIRWYNLSRVNNRTHRTLVIVDGRVAFLGGAGIADQWLYGIRGSRRWRDTMFRVEGPAVTDLQSTFVENWVEASGEIIADTEYFPDCTRPGDSTALVIDSSPSLGQSSRARILFQTLLTSARGSVCISTPYFLPDRSARAEMVLAVKERGVKITIITPGRHTDHLLTRTSSQRLYGELLRAGVRIFEYRPSMLHAKVMIVDGLWSIVGSTNFDNRSFLFNDEVNMAVLDSELASRLQQDFSLDLADSREILFEEWKRRSLFERAHEWLGWVLERQE